MQIFSVSQFHIQTQKGAVNLLDALQALLCVSDCPEKRFQKANVRQKETSVFFPAWLEVIALVFGKKMRMKVSSKYWLHARVELEDFSRVQLTFTDQALMELCWILRRFSFCMSYLHEKFFSLRKILFVKFGKSSQARDALLQLLPGLKGKPWPWTDLNMWHQIYTVTFAVHPVTMVRFNTVTNTLGLSERDGWLQF